MTTDIENQTMELLAATVEDEKKNVTYRWLSRSMGYSVNTAKQLMESYLSTVGKGKVHGTYYLAREDPKTGSRVISLVSQENIQEAKKDASVIGYHIYSLEPSPLKDLAILSAVNAEAIMLQKGKDINTFRIVCNKEVIVSASNNRPSVSSVASASASSTSAATSKATIPAKQPAAASLKAASASSLTVPAVPPSITHPTTSAASTPSSKSKAKAGTPASKSSMMSFFGKAANAAPKANNATTAASAAVTTTSSAAASKLAPQKRKADLMASSNSNNKSSQWKDTVDSDEEEVDSEEERDRRLALSSRLDQDQGDVVNESKSKSAGAVDVDAVKKRQRSARLLALDDDDEVDESKTVGGKANTEPDEVEDEHLETLSRDTKRALSLEKEQQQKQLEEMMQREDEDSPMVDVEALDEPEAASALALASASATESSTNPPGKTTRRIRGVRNVVRRKTFKNERGYMVTEDVVEQESFSEDEVVNVPAPAAAPAFSRIADKSAEPQARSSSGPKKKGGSGNQSLLNFFTKK